MSTKATQKNQTAVLTKMTVIAMLSAVAVALQYLEFPLPMLIPPFIKLDFSDIPELIGAFIVGPGGGVLIALIKNLIHSAVSQSFGVGELSNFLLGAAFAFTAGMIYKHHKTKKGAVIGCIAGSVVMAVVSLITNYLIIYPVYSHVSGSSSLVVTVRYMIGLIRESGDLSAKETFSRVHEIIYHSDGMNQIVGMYKTILPSSDTLEKSLLIFNLPFTLVKGILCSAVTVFVYKPLSNLIKELNKKITANSKKKS